MRRWLLPVVAGLACLAWTQGPDAPRLGWLVDDAGGLRPIAGLAGNFVPGEPRLADVVSAASSGEWTLVKTDRALIVLDRTGHEAARLATQSGTARFGFTPGGEPAAAFLPDDDLLFLWRGGRFETASWQVGGGGQVEAIACPDPGTISMLIRRDTSIWRVDRAASDGGVTLERVLPGVGAPALMHPDGSVIYTDGRTLIRRASDGVEKRVGLPNQILDLNELGSGLVNARAARGAFAVLFLGAEPRVFELPGGAR